MRKRISISCQFNNGCLHMYSPMLSPGSDVTLQGSSLATNSPKPKKSQCQTNDTTTTNKLLQSALPSVPQPATTAQPTLGV